MISNVIRADSSLLKLAHTLIAEAVNPGDYVIDATVGNGHDTAFLLDLVKPHGRVFGFDIQQAALTSALSLANSLSDPACLTLFHASHADMANFIPAGYTGNLCAIIFNLGYLPGGDKTIITRCDSTIAALQAALDLLGSGGMLTIMAYPGHEGGSAETVQVEQWCHALNRADFQCQRFENRPNNPAAPKLFCVKKIKPLKGE